MLEPGTPGPFDFRSQRSRSAETTPQPFTSETLPHLRLAGHHQDYTLKALLAAGSPVLQEDAISRACFVAAARDKLFREKLFTVTLSTRENVRSTKFGTNLESFIGILYFQLALWFCEMTIRIRSSQ